MIKVVALYRAPAYVEAFERHYFDIHIPLVKKTPGLRSLEVLKITGVPLGKDGFHLMATMEYDSIDAMNAANATPEGKAVGKDLFSFAKEVVTVMIGEVAG
jgi:uncharacterized protein (TIGR02118 family)